MPNSEAVNRAMNMTKKALIDLGYEVVSFDIEDDIKKIMPYYFYGMEYGSLYTNSINELIESGETLADGISKGRYAKPTSP